MANIKIISFGRLKEILGSDFELEAENSDELLNQLNEKFPQLEDLKLRIAVNQKIISENTDLKNNDVVALMPPYSGG
ncbi:MoaD/ThiS family protein [Epilithonimonas sp. JDS]|uniref:MoaD/ThiS family protein n=1 Tax=Epilithonimonas sp. JDS TaxID=2902797 RepID=UPI001E4AC8F7|nr:MoaD/ThiS family protein [Epilithonimonas sp. JDS]MCD9856672.1 MoaD/ThiS family protein [Epilithonimonas sp. JDS]